MLQIENLALNVASRENQQGRLVELTFKKEFAVYIKARAVGSACGKIWFPPSFFIEILI